MGLLSSKPDEGSVRMSLSSAVSAAQGAPIEGCGLPHRNDSRSSRSQATFRVMLRPLYETCAIVMVERKHLVGTEARPRFGQKR